MDKMEQRLAVSAAIGAGSHIPGPAPVPSHETGGQRHQQHLEEAAGQLECMTQEAPPADPDAAQLLNAHGLIAPENYKVRSNSIYTTNVIFRAAPFAGVMRNWSQAQRRVRDRSAYCQN